MTTRLGVISDRFDSFVLKDVLIKNESGTWGLEPNGNSTGIIRSTNFTNQGKLDLSNVAYRSIDEENLQQLLLQENEILIERSGGSDNQPVGRVGFIDKEIEEKKLAFANFIQRISVDDLVHPKFVYYCLQQMYERGVTNSMQYQTTGIRNLDFKLYTKSVLPKPPIPEQLKIASILTKVDDTIQAVKNSIEKVERLKKSLMQNLLTGKLKPDGTWRTDDEFKDIDKYGWVPVDWDYGKLGDIAEIIAGQSPIGETYNENGGGIPMLNGPTEFTDRYPVPVQWTTKPTKLCKVGDILFTVRGSSTGRMNIADQEYCIGRGIAAIREIEDKSNIDYIFYLLIIIANKILAEAKGAGSTFPNVNRTELLKKRIIYPNESTQKLIAEKINSVDKIVITKQQKIQKLERLKKSLMQNLLTGKVRVKV